MREIRSVKIIALFLGRVPRRIEDMRCLAVIIRRPLVEMVCDIESSRVGRRIFKIYDNNLSNMRKDKVSLEKILSRLR